MKKLVLFVVAVMLMASCCFAFVGCGETKTQIEDFADFVLDVEEGRDVKILQLTDIQIIDAAQCRSENRLNAASKATWATDQMENVAFKYMRQIVARVQPDIIVLTGDNVYGEFDDNGTVLQKLIAELDSYKIPWAAAFGNHDNESAMGVVWQCEQMANAEYSLFKRGNDLAEGNGNYTVAIRQGEKITEMLYMIDTHGCAYSVDGDEEGVHRTPGFMEGQLEWIRQTGAAAMKFNGNKKVPSLGFFHYPIRGFGDAMQQYNYYSPKHGFYDENGDWKSFKPVSIPENDNGDCGVLHTDVSGYVDSEYRFRDLFYNIGGEGVFFGHDHTNNASVALGGMRYTYGLKASAYDSHNKNEIGGTQILVGVEGLRVEHVYYDSNWSAE